MSREEQFATIIGVVAFIASVAFGIIPAFVAAWRGRSQFSTLTGWWYRPSWLLVYAAVGGILSITSMVWYRGFDGPAITILGIQLVTLWGFVRCVASSPVSVPDNPSEPYLKWAARTLVRSVLGGGLPTGLRPIGPPTFRLWLSGILLLVAFGCGLLTHTLLFADGIPRSLRVTWLALDGSIILFACLSALFLRNMSTGRGGLRTLAVLMWLIAASGLFISLILDH